MDEKSGGSGDIVQYNLSFLSRSSEVYSYEPQAELQSNIPLPPPPPNTTALESSNDFKQQQKQKYRLRYDLTFATISAPIYPSSV